MELAAAIFYLFILSNLQAFTSAFVLYTDSNHTGINISVNISECTNLPKKIRGQVSSINTTGNCGRLYTKDNCSGSNAIELPFWSPPSDDLREWGFNDKTYSVGPCLDTCSEQVTNGTVTKAFEVTIFEKSHFRGACEEVRVVGCTELPSYFTRRIDSIDTRGYCVELYDDYECNRGKDSFQLRPGMPHYDNLTRWKNRPSDFKAISHCSYNCTDSAIEKFNFVTLYDKTNFSGIAFKIDVEIRPERCIDLRRSWDGAAKSIEIVDHVCVDLFDRRGCDGNFVSLKSSLANLTDIGSNFSQYGFSERTRSIRGCNFTENTAVPDTDNQTPSMPPLILAVAITVPLLVVVVVLSMAVFILMRMYRKMKTTLTEKEIQEFVNGLELNGSEYVDSVEDKVAPTGDNYYSMMSVEILAQSQPYNQDFEIARFRINFDGKAPIGVGEFGAVYKGVVHQECPQKNIQSDNKNGSIPVAIKTVKPGVGVDSLRSLLKEVKVMLYLGKHSYIVQMVGCCTENLRKGEIFVLMEYCSNGSLDVFLQKNRYGFNSDKMQVGNEFSAWNNNPYCTLADMEAISTEKATFDFSQLLKWCIEVARGMEFLSMSKVIHSDLAARNVLLTDNLQAKIADFGLSKQLYRYTQYTKKKEVPLPWRWLAIESLKRFEFSTKSDVWSYGIFCWEVFSVGDTPYEGVGFGSDFISSLEAGQRLQKPKYANGQCYNLMTSCWAEDPNLRPSFTDIIKELENCFQTHENSSYL